MHDERSHSGRWLTILLLMAAGGVIVSVATSGFDADDLDADDLAVASGDSTLPDSKGPIPTGHSPKGTTAAFAESRLPLAAGYRHGDPEGSDLDRRDGGTAATLAPSYPVGTFRKPPKPVEPTEPAPLHAPRVVLSMAHAMASHVVVGDLMPDLMLADSNGEACSLRTHWSEKLTVVVFWRANQPLGRELYDRLESRVVRPFHERGLRVIAVHVGPSSSLPARDGVVDLVDAGEMQFEQLATHLTPRTYLLDAEGSVLWMDVEYSQSTERELINAIQWFLLPPASRPDELEMGT